MSDQQTPPWAGAEDFEASTDPETPPTPQNAAQPLAHLAGREICAECPWRGCRHCQWQGGE